MAGSETWPKLLYSNGATTKKPLPMIEANGVTIMVHILDRRARAIPGEQHDHFAVVAQQCPRLITHAAVGRHQYGRDVAPAAGGALAGRLRYVLADTSPGMREEAARTVPEARVVVPGVPGAGVFRER